MEPTNKIITRDNQTTDELRRNVVQQHKGLSLQFEEVYYLDFEVDEETGMVNRNQLAPHFTSAQMERNLKSLKSAYNIARGAASPNEIMDFRNKYHLAASTFSIVLGFSKNTISNIENEGALSLPSGRLIKVAMNDPKIMHQYIDTCDELDKYKKEELSRIFR